MNRKTIQIICALIAILFLLAAVIPLATPLLFQ